MSNPHYTNTLVAVPLTTISSQAVEQQLDAIEAGFDDMTGKADAANGVHTGTLDATGATAVLVPSLTVAETTGAKAANVDYVKAYVGASTTGLPALAGNALRLLRVAADALSVEWAAQYPSHSAPGYRFLRSDSVGNVDWYDPIPIGGVIASYTFPIGYLEANGATCLQSAYPDLFAAVGHPPGYSTAALRLSALSTAIDAPAGVCLSADGTYFATAATASPYVKIFKRTGDVFATLADPATLPAGNAKSVAFSADNAYLAVGHNVSPFVTIYKRSGDSWVKLADPGTLPAGQGNGVAWSSDGAYLAVAHNVSPFVTVYSRSGDVFTKLTNPATLPAAAGLSASFSPNTDFLTIGHQTTPYQTTYYRSGSTLTKIADPSTVPAGNGNGVAWGDDTYLAVAHATTPFVTFYSKSGSGAASTLTKMTDPATLPASTGNGAAMSSDAEYAFIAHSTTPFITVYQRSGSTWAKLTNPSSLPANTGLSVSLGFGGIMLAVGFSHGDGVAFYSPWGYDSATEFALPLIEIEKNALSERNGEKLRTYIRAL